MKRCNRPALAYSWFNGYRCCPKCLEDMRPETRANMVPSLEVVGPCDRPIETPAQFWARYPDATWHRHHA